MVAYGETYTNLRVETVPAFRYIKHALSQEQINVFNMHVNGLEHTEKEVIPCFDTDGESMDIYIACK